MCRSALSQCRDLIPPCAPLSSLVPLTTHTHPHPHSHNIHTLSHNTQCPFLGELAKQNGQQFARSIALDPTVPASTNSSSVRRPVLEEDLSGLSTYAKTFQAFHGKHGLCPLSRCCAPTRPAAPVDCSPPAADSVSVAAPPAAAGFRAGGLTELPKQQRHRASRQCCRSSAASPHLPSQQQQQQHLLLGSGPLPVATLSLSFGRNLVSQVLSGLLSLLVPIEHPALSSPLC